MTGRFIVGIVCAFAVVAGCSSSDPTVDPGEQSLDPRMIDGGASDGGGSGNTPQDGGSDTGPRPDGGKPGGPDGGRPDAGGGRDAGPPGRVDAGTVDAGEPGGPTCKATSGEPACDPCLAEYCCAPAEVCNANAECNAIIACVQSKCDKGDNGCIYSCYSAHPRGQSDVTKMVQCLQKYCAATCPL